MYQQNIHSYDDIIHLSRPISKKHPQMPIRDRAAQFAPFAALTGHKEAISETERLTDAKRILIFSDHSWIPLDDIYEIELIGR